MIKTDKRIQIVGIVSVKLPVPVSGTSDLMQGYSRNRKDLESNFVWLVNSNEVVAVSQGLGFVIGSRLAKGGSHC